MVDKGRTRARTIWNAPRVHKCKKKKNQRNPIKWKWSKNTFFFMIIILKYTTATSERHSHQRTWHQKKVHERNKYKKINDDFSWRSKTVDKSYFLNQNEFHRFVTNGGFFSPFFFAFRNSYIFARDVISFWYFLADIYLFSSLHISIQLFSVVGEFVLRDSTEIVRLTSVCW